MKSVAVTSGAVLLWSICAVGFAAQEVPKGINYKTASAEVNALAKSSLEQALANPDKLPVDLFSDVFVCGPMLWKSLKPSADHPLLEAKPVVVMTNIPEPIVAEGKRILNEQERESFWRGLQSRYAKLKDSRVRKGNAEEISYYWATISFDIEEPFFVIDTGSERFVANMKVNRGKAHLFWIDLVGDLKRLKAIETGDPTATQVAKHQFSLSLRVPTVQAFLMSIGR